MSVARFGVSLENDLLEALDEYVLSNKFPNRSQAIRHLTYNYNKNDIQAKLSEIKRNAINEILSAQHFYICDEKALEIIAVKEPSHKLTELSEKMISIKQKRPCSRRIAFHRNQ